MNTPLEPLPQPEEEPSRISRARRRRRSRRLVPEGADQRAALLERLAQRAYPTIEFFLLCLLAGAIMGAGYLLDSQVVLFIGVLLIPVLTPWLGMILATVTGSWRFFFQTLGAFVIGGLLVFLAGMLAGFASRALPPLTLGDAFYHSRLWWPHLIVLAIGAILLPVSFARSERWLLLPSAMLAFCLYLPLSAAAIGLGSGIPGLWPAGVLVFLIQFGLASLIGVVTMLVMGFRPYTLAGYTLGTTLILAGILALVLLGGFGSALASRFAIPGFTTTATPAQGRTALPTPTSTRLSALAASPSPTPKPSTATPTASLTLTATLVFPTVATPTGTPSPNPTPYYAIISSPGADGVIMRDAPGGKVVTSIANGLLVEIISEVERVNNFNWVKVRIQTPTGAYEGWVIQDFLKVATPVPNWSPSPTP